MYRDTMKHVTVFRAELFLAEFDTAGVLGSYHNVGLMSSYDLADSGLDIEEIMDSRQVTGTPAKRITAKVAPSWAGKLKSADPDNLALFQLGELGTYTQAATAITAQELGKVKVGAVFDLGMVKIASVQHVQTKVVSPATPIAFDVYVPSTGLGHYVLHADEGTIEIVALPDDVDSGDVIECSYTPTAIAAGAELMTILGATKTRKECRALIVGTSGEGLKYKTTLWKVAVEPDGALPTISEKSIEFGLKLTCLTDGVHTELWKQIRLTEPA